LQLDGAAKDYFLGASGVTGVAGSGLFHDSNANANRAGWIYTLARHGSAAKTNRFVGEDADAAYSLA